MASFGPCIDWILRLEDRTLSGVTKDLGDGAGRTRFGVTEKNHPDLLESFFTTADLGAALETAKNVYWEEYWNPIHGILLPTDELAATLLSFAVNDGVGTAVKLLQDVLGVPQDGRLGEHTLFAIGQGNVAQIASKLRESQETFYRQIVERDPSKINDLKGWLRRAQAVYPDLPA